MVSEPGAGFFIFCHARYCAIRMRKVGSLKITEIDEMLGKAGAQDAALLSERCDVGERRYLNEGADGPVNQRNAHNSGRHDASDCLELVVIEMGLLPAHNGVFSHAFHVVLPEIGQQAVARFHFIGHMPRINSLSGNFVKKIVSSRESAPLIRRNSKELFTRSLSAL